MISRGMRRSSIPLAAVLGLLAPAAASAARPAASGPMDAPTTGLTASAGALYGVEPSLSRLVQLAVTADGSWAAVQDIPLPGDPGAATLAAPGPSGHIWVALSSG